MHVRQAHHTIDDVRVCPEWRGRERRGPERVSTSEVIRNMKYCTYLICLHSCTGVDLDLDESLRRGGWYRNSRVTRGGREK